MKTIKKKTKKKMTKQIEWDGTTVKIDRENYNKLKDMFNSPDKENHTVAFGVIENIDMKVSLPYVLLLYKAYKDSSPEGWKVILPKMEKVLKQIGKGKLDDTTFNNIYKIIKGTYPKEDVQVMADEYCDELKKQVTSWAFGFLSEMDMKLIVRDA